MLVHTAHDLVHAVLAVRVSVTPSMLSNALQQDNTEINNMHMVPRTR
jgi:hypothetical protein